MKRLAFALALLTAFTACAKKEAAAPESPVTDTAPRTQAAVNAASVLPTSTAVASADAPPEPSLVSVAAGALVVVSPPQYSDGWGARFVIDEYPDTGWATPKGDVAPKTFVIELPERTLLDRLEFDIASADGEKRGAREVSVEMSDAGVDAGFQAIADVTLVPDQDRQSFPTSAQIPGRWVRLTVKNNHGAADYIELMDFRGYGRQLTTTPFPDASGTYQTQYGLFHLKQEGTAVTGCYEHDGGLLTGGIEGRVMKLTWRESGGDQDQGPALMVFTSDREKMLGLWGGFGAEKLTGLWDGKKVSNEVGSCPHWSPKGGAEERIADELDRQGRTRLYGINFDTDSAVIRAESKPTLDKVVAVLGQRPQWKLTIEGHTDSSGGDAHNQPLSEQRAESVKSYLVAAGVSAERLTSRGMGAGVPLAPNDTAMGRAQNRRVELVRE